MLRHIIYQAHGNQDILHECLFSIASLQRLKCIKEDVRLHVFTDQQEYFRRFLHIPVIYHDMSSQDIREWRGEINFIHRVKIKVLQQVCSQVSRGSILYLDTDVIALKEPDILWRIIESGKFVMHAREGAILHSNVSIFKKLIPVLQHGVASGLMTTNNIDMWNAGVLGFRAEQSAALKDVLALTDKLYAFKPKHVMEQLGFSYVFQQGGDLLAADDIFYHYWNLKEFRRILHEVYNLPAEKRDKIIHSFFQKHTVQQLFAAKQNYYSRPLNRLYKILFSKKWETPRFDKLIRDYNVM